MGGRTAASSMVSRHVRNAQWKSACGTSPAYWLNSLRRWSQLVRESRTEGANWKIRACKGERLHGIGVQHSFQAASFRAAPAVLSTHAGGGDTS